MITTDRVQRLAYEKGLYPSSPPIAVAGIHEPATGIFANHSSERSFYEPGACLELANADYGPVARISRADSGAHHVEHQ